MRTRRPLVLLALAVMSLGCATCPPPPATVATQPAPPLSVTGLQERIDAVVSGGASLTDLVDPARGVLVLTHGVGEHESFSASRRCGAILMEWASAEEERWRDRATEQTALYRCSGAQCAGIPDGAYSPNETLRFELDRTGAPVLVGIWSLGEGEHGADEALAWANERSLAIDAAMPCPELAVSPLR